MKDQSVDALVDEFVSNRIGRREFLRRAGLAGVSATMAASILAACGGSDSASTSSAATSGGSAPVPKGGVLKYGGVGDQGSMDPATSAAGIRGGSIDGIYEGLVQLDPSNNLVQRNVLAEKYEISPDGTQISFTLKPNMQFHAGYGEVTAEDVKFSIERAAGKIPMYPDATKADVSYYVSDWITLKQVTVNDKYSGVIELTKPFDPVFNIALPFDISGAITSKKAVNALGRTKFPTHPVGTGPYELDSYVPNNKLVLKRFDKYKGNDPFPYQWDSIEASFTALSGDSDPGATLAVPLQTGEIDALPSFQKKSSASQLEGNDAFKVVTLETPGYVWLSMNVQHPKLEDVRVRQAIRVAVDPEAILQLNSVPETSRANAIIAPSYGPGYWADAPTYNRDVDKAKSLLQEAGVSNLELNLYSSDQAAAQVIQSNLKDVGIKVNIVQTTYDKWFTNKEVAELTYWSYSAGVDLYYQLEWWQCNQVEIYNTSFWCNPEYGKLLNKLGSEPDVKKQAPIAVQMQQMMDESAGFVWFYYPVTYAASKSNIKMVFDRLGLWYPSRFVSV